MATRIELSGGFRVLRDGVPVAIPYQRARALLAFLALEPGRHSRERLADLLWPDETRDAGRDSLRRMLSVLRTALGPEREALAADRNGVALALGGGLSCDAGEFLARTACRREICEPTGRTLCVAEAEQAIAAYRGRLLADLELDGAPDFAHWLDVRREAFDRQAAARLDQLAACLERAGDRAGALHRLDQLIQLDPASEPAHLRAMTLLAEDGRRPEALARYEALRRYLAEELGARPGPACADLAAAIAASDPAARPAAAPDRRPLTVLCLRVAVDGLDEDAGAERIAAELPRLSQGVADAGGHVGSVLAGTLVAWFGYPEAREQAARHALDCALALAGPTVAAGVETGLAVCDPAGGLADLAGQVTRTALDLAARAPAGRVWLGTGAEAASAGRFPTLPLAGAFQVAGGPADTPSSQARPPLLGRDAEAAQLRAAWQTAQAGGRSAVLVRGNAGIGKSRLVSDLFDTLADALVVRCRAEDANAPFLPIANLLGEALALPDGTDRHTCRLAVATRLPGLAEADRRRLAEFLSGRQAAPLPPAPAAREALIEALARSVAALAAGRPLLLWIEDAHWADPSTLATLARLTAALPDGLCLVVTARPPFQPAWPVTTLDLAGLSPEASLELVTRLAGAEVPAQRLGTLLERAEGVPLFIESLVHAARRGGGGLPATLAELLAARLDAMGEARATAQLAAAAGRRFSLGLLATAVPDNRRLARHLDAMVAVGLMRHEREPGRYAFGHALIQEAAYHSMPAATRRAHHAALGDALLAGDPGLASREPALLAWHYAGAERHDEACRYAVGAARLASARLAPAEALGYLDGALDHAGKLAAGPTRAAAELEIRLHQGPLLALRHGFGSREAREAYGHALRLAGPGNDVPEMFPLLWGLWLGSSSWADHDVSLDLARRLQRLAPLRAGDPYARGHAHYALGNSLLSRGEFSLAAETLEAGVDGYPAEAPLSPYGEDAAVTNLAMLSWARWFLGQDDAALDAASRAVKRARLLDHPHTLCYALVLAGILYRMMGQVEATRAHAEEALRLGREHDLALWAAAGQAVLGWTKAALGDPAGLAELFDSANRSKDIMGGIETMFLAQVVDACERLGAWPQALEATEMGLAIGQAKRDRHYKAEFLRIKALALAELGREGADGLLARAELLAREQGAVALSRRIGATRARLSGCPSTAD